MADAKWEARQFIQQNVCKAQQLETPMAKKRQKCMSRSWKQRGLVACVWEMWVRPVLDPSLTLLCQENTLPTLAEDWKFVQSTGDPEPDTSGRKWKIGNGVILNIEVLNEKGYNKIIFLSSPQIPWFQSSQVYHIFQTEN